MNIKKWLNGFCLSIVFIAGLFMVEMSAQAKTVYNSPYVTFSPDGEAFTTNHQDKNWEWYDEGTKVTTGIPSSLRGVEVGEHYYKKERRGNIPIEKWEVVHKNSVCCHNAYPDEADPYHNIEFRRKECLDFYYSGWNSYCADCHEPISYMLMYMSKEAAQSITELDLSLEYYYTCPHCTNLEQGSNLDYHNCKAISWNKYKVKYIENANRVGGYMNSSIHMYNNATEYEGDPFTPATRLTKNTFTRTGYEFMGWNTKADGSGTPYTDNQEILNLTTDNYNGEEKGIITLYAQWKKSESTLHINPNGGTYQGNYKLTSVTQTYRTTYTIDPKDIIPPKGYQVSFVTGYTAKTPDIMQTRTFQEWQRSNDFHGKLEDNTYTYMGTEGMEDTITVTYSYDSVTLPTPVGIKEDSSSFGGWYYDQECTSPAGKAGDKITPSSNLTLYAKRVDLLLKSVNNMKPYGASGAVDLSWEQNDGFEKTYLLYQSVDNKTWNQIYDASDLTETKNVNLSYNWNGRSNQGTYTIPYTGFYTLTAFGAKGGNYGNYKGGYGGKVEGKIWLTKGEKITYILGGEDGSNGGGKGDSYGSGGGCTVIATDKKGAILVAGGGGGATSQGNGGLGGSTASNLTTGYNGENGGAGGGGGYKGGKAGQVLVHNHVTACRHTHTGSTSVGGGCYTVRLRCGSTGFINKDVENGKYYGNEYQNANGKWCYDGDCSRCPGGDGICSGHPKVTTYYKCSRCGTDYGTSKPNTCTVDYGYAIGCGRNESYTCGYTQGQVIKHVASSGGSNYVNTTYVTSNTSKIGIQNGNGSFTITSEQVGFEETLNLNEVKATDLSSPNKVVLPKDAKTDLGNNKVKIVWNKSKDNGTVYYHKAESYQKQTNNKISTSNTTRNELISGTKGYYYLIDTKANTMVVATNGTFISNTFTTVTAKDYVQYLHISAVDVAGNISTTTHIPIELGDLEIAWNVFTDKMQISSLKDSIYRSNDTDTYYVKADGKTPFLLNFNGNIKNNASKSYQVNHLVFETSIKDSYDSTNIQYCLQVPNASIIQNTSIQIPFSDIHKIWSDSPLLLDDNYITITRSDFCKNLEVLHRFTMPSTLHGETIKVTPRAGATWQSKVMYSNYQKDILNSIYLIGDSIPPEISGIETLEDWNHVVLSAKDADSGLREFYVIVTNYDNGGVATFRANEEGLLHIDISEDDTLFLGDFAMEFHAIDKVGNEKIEHYGSKNLSVTAYIDRILEPHTPIFRGGESGNLYITTRGYVEKVEIIFPEEFVMLNDKLNQVIEYPIPTHYKEEVYKFMIPLYSPEGTFQVKIKAYKDDEVRECNVSFTTLGEEENVLNDIRTRLR